ncbi:NAD(P)/FAD-dependent oxidoreductase [Natronobacterium gregoryi]|uniref:FAD dependent oxidoreductase n=2 Tax=Natronobacterium gregoryi TaxID=44930 RepID=L0ADA8_NATGS|nr:FAD-dependent oxidoreductase [Natronobacterium gregoryi]AFZ71836.1 glycine/D-amino acid oxidase, deaminating [Natronobacterium gregoryi SP2]ELY72990.1 FAD dependent oxidoreductase [Natronobacterium gregoryi SP2]PLK19132.1 FAD-binding oxidoreductase [Natronobacterium gregoryi SP2]SFJ60277.1 Glycine/D-amino acid oxidase [Natronobacterium gregoryi]
MNGDSDPDLAVGADAFTDESVEREVAVVGGGAVGATAAYDLARAGADVTLYDRDGIASGASGRAAGVCYDAYADPLDAEIASDAIERFRTLSGDDTFPFVECPYVWLAQDGDERADAIRDQVTRMQEHGVVALEMDADALADRFDSIRTDDVEAAGIAGAAGYTDPARYTAALAAGANGAGAELEAETPVAIRTDPPRVVPEGGDEREVDAVLVTAGAHTKQVLADAGVEIPMKPYRVQALVADCDLEEPTCFDATAGFYVRPHPDGILAGDGTELREVDPDRYDRKANDEFAEDLLERVQHRLPDVDPELERAWAGLCTSTPDGDPLVGEIEDGVYVATGFQGHGFMRAPAVGERIAMEVLGGDGIDAFDPTRFDGGETFEVTEGMQLGDERER